MRPFKTRSVSAWLKVSGLLLSAAGCVTMASAVKPASDSPLLPLEPFQIKDVPSEEDSYIILSYGTSADGFTICIHPEGGDPTKWPTHIRRFSVNTASLPAETEPTPEPEETPQSDFSPKGAVWL